MRGDLYKKFELELLEKEVNKNYLDKKEKIEMINIDLLDSYNNHIFSPMPVNKLNELKESIERFGILSPIIVRQKENRYEIISGHNRVKCCRELGLKEIPTIVKDYNNDMAELVMIETNLAQRENILPCEKGLAYKKQLELIKKLKIENSMKSSNTNTYMETTQCEHQNKSIDELAYKSEDGRTAIQRLIRLTELISELQNKVNKNDISILAGVELSYLDIYEQNIVNSIIDLKRIKLSILQAKRLKSFKGNITEENVFEIITGKTKNSFTGTLSKKIYKKYKHKFKNNCEYSELIDILLENYFNNLSDK